MKVTLEKITKKFGSTVAVNDFSVTLPDGHLICLLGPSGCGKSTILNMLCGITKVTSGHIYFDNDEVTNLPPDQRNIGMVFQNYALYPHLTVLENIAFPLEIKKIPKKERLERAEKIAKLVHVDMLLKRYPGELSGGQQQRVAIARALIKNPKLLLMDEPLSNLDARLRLEMREEIRRIQVETGVTTIFVTHDQEEAMAISDSIILMKDGNLVQKGLCQELYNQPNCKFVSDFLGNPPINQIKIDDSFIEKLGWQLSLDEKSSAEKEEKTVEPGKSLVLAVRPESFLISKIDFADSKLKGKIIKTTEMGKEKIAYLDFLGTEVRALIYTDEVLSDGDEVVISFRNKGVFVFDEKSGARLM